MLYKQKAFRNILNKSLLSKTLFSDGYQGNNKKQLPVEIKFINEFIETSIAFRFFKTFIYVSNKCYEEKNGDKMTCFCFVI